MKAAIGWMCSTPPTDAAAPQAREMPLTAVLMAGPMQCTMKKSSSRKAAKFVPVIGLNNNYDDSLYFASNSAKDSYFSGLTKLATATAMSYNREQRGYIRVELPMATVISASYMRFKNTSFENKWFYAFILNVEYINNNCTQINFEIDVLMTWMGVFTLGQCFIERQHTVGDAIGANIADEGLNLGLYVCEDTDYYSLGDPVVAIYKTYNL